MNAADFEAVYRRHHSLVLSIASNRLGEVAFAEDITNEVFSLAWEHSQQGGTVTLAWLYRTLRNLVANQYRREQRTAQTHRLLGASQATDQLPDDEIHDALIIRNAMAELREKDRELLMMAYWDDLTRTEIAGILGCTSVTARVRLTRARRRLLAKLGIGAQQKGHRDE